MNCGDKSRAKSLASTLASASTQDFEPSDKARKNKKKKQHKDKRDLSESRDSITPATGVNKAKVGGKRKNDISEITCYNCNKKGYYATKCPETRKSKKLVSVLATSMLVTGTREKAVRTVKAVWIVEIDKDSKESKSEYWNLAQVPCIWYPIIF